MKHLIVFITAFLFFSITARAGDFKVLWEMDFPSGNNVVQVSDDGKYFYYTDDSGYVYFHDSETGHFLNKLFLSKLVLYGANYYLNNDRMVLPASLDSILIYNITTNVFEATIDLAYNVDEANIRLVSLTKDKRYLSLICFFNEERHLIIVDLEQKKLYKDLKLIDYIDQIFNTTDPNRMIIVTDDQHGYHLEEMILDATQEMGYRINRIEDVDKDGYIRGEKYDADEDAIYYLYLPYDLGKRLSKYEFQNKKTTNLYEGLLANENIWFSEDNNVILYQNGDIYNLSKKEWYNLRLIDNIQQYASSCERLKTVLLRVYKSNIANNHKLKRFDIKDVISNINYENYNHSMLSPNPTTGILNILINNKFPSLFRYDIISDSGQSILSNDIGFLQPQNNTLSINISPIPIGHYLLKISSDREVFTFNIIKEG